MLDGVAEALNAAIGMPVRLAEPAVELDRKGLALDDQALTEASYRWLTAVGLALWGTDAYGKPSLLPPEVLVKRQQRRLTVSAAAAVAVVAVGLCGLSFQQIRSADKVSSQIRSYDASGAALQQKISALGYVLAVPAELQARRQLAVDALSGDIDWLGMVQRIRAAMPHDVSPQGIALTKVPLAVGAPATVPEIVGALQMTAQTTGGAQSVAEFIERVSRVKGLYALWVSSTTNAQGSTLITATADLTSASLSNRAAGLPGGSK